MTGNKSQVEIPAVAAAASEMACPLLLANPRDFALVESSCAEAMIETIRCSNADDLLGAVTCGCGPVLVADETMTPDDWKALAHTIDNQPEWSDLPLVVLTRAATSMDAIRPVKNRRSTTCLQRPTDRHTLKGMLNADVEFRKRQYQVRNLLGELRQANKQLDARASQLQHLALALTQAENDERRRVAEMLHDGLQQLLAAGRVTLSQQLADHPDKEQTQALRKLDTILQDAIASSRTLTRQLSPPLLYQSGLGPALEQLANQAKREYDLDVSVTCPEEAPDVDERVRAFLYEAARELLFNIHKHAASRTAHMALTAPDGTVELSISDQGEGFDTAILDRVNQERTGFGIFGLRERIELLGGTFEVDSSPGSGTRVALRIPPDMPVTSESAPEKRPRPVTSAESPPRSPAEQPPPLRVIVVDDHRVMRNGLVAMLEDKPEIDVVGEANDGTTAIEKARRLHPDVAVVDVSLPDISGVEVTRKLVEENPDIHVIGLSMFEEGTVANQMIEAGAAAYLVKSGPAQSLISSILACRE